MFDNGGSILNFASEAAIRGFTGSMAGVHYSASKGAVIAMSRQLAVEWGQYQIRVNSICPGGVLTSTIMHARFSKKVKNLLQQDHLGMISQKIFVIWHGKHYSCLSMF